MFSGWSFHRWLVSHLAETEYTSISGEKPLDCLGVGRGYLGYSYRLNVDGSRQDPIAFDSPGQEPISCDCPEQNPVSCDGAGQDHISCDNSVQDLIS